MSTHNLPTYIAPKNQTRKFDDIVRSRAGDERQSDLDKLTEAVKEQTSKVAELVELPKPEKDNDSDTKEEV